MIFKLFRSGGNVFEFSFRLFRKRVLIFQVLSEASNVILYFVFFSIDAYSCQKTALSPTIISLSGGKFCSDSTGILKFFEKCKKENYRPKNL